MIHKSLSESTPVAPLRFIATPGSEQIGETINQILVRTRAQRIKEHPAAFHAQIPGYLRDDYRVDYEISRFGSGEAKGLIRESIRGCDLFIFCDPVNNEASYTMNQQTNRTSPDDRFADLKRIIAASSGMARRINVIMPFLYEGRQHRRSKPESLDCALMLQELANMGVENFITFDAHDPRVSNAIPQLSFDNFFTSYQFIQKILEVAPDMIIDKEHVMTISPDEGGMARAVYYATMLGVDMGMFYKRRDYSTVVDGRNPIVAHEFLGNDVEGKDVIIIDDMISSGESMCDVARELKKRRAKRIFICCTFGLFNKGFKVFDRYYEEGVFDQIFTTNLTWTPPEAFTKPYYSQVDLTRYIALIIDTLNHDCSVNEIIDTTERIHQLLASRR
ncbi:MAG: ribose-phosphate pyrophosphokinase [Lachnospiraceae bacterium]|nr:ribose-phosphate pyrophosphokinase [Lachnospiraceae bacterium]MBQ9561871.1 ribose-phosphate pyrophosphokinase [Lachnospiraceae bacterium]